MDLSGLAQLAEGANWVDWTIVIILAIAALDGVRRGLVRGSLDLLGLVVVFGAAVVGYPYVASALERLMPMVGFRLPEQALSVLAFVIMLLVTQVLYALLSGWLSDTARALLGVVPTVAALERVLGLAPGLVRGAMLSLLLLLPLTLLPFVPEASTAVGESILGSRLVGVALAAAPEVESRLGRDLASGLPSVVLTPPNAEETERLDIGPTGPLVTDPDAEQRMLELINRERVANGLRPLTFDEELRPVARAHSRDMFEQGYFSHTSPTTGSPFDRIRAAGVRFVIAGENLAYARNVQLAHDGLMRSPGHRANILRPEFGRVGIGVLRSDLQGSMFTQNFRD